MVRIVSWNIARAVRPKGLDGDPWSVLLNLDPDIALLQEARTPPSGFPGHYHLNATPRGWGTAIWSKLELSDLDHLPDSSRVEVEQLMPALAGYVASAQVQLPNAEPLRLVSIHAYPAPVRDEYLAGADRTCLKCENAKAVWPGDLVWWLTRELPLGDANVVLGGDWNTARLFDEVYGPRGNQEFFSRMSETGWCEALRKFEKSEVRTYFRDGRGDYQLDHVFVTEPLFSALERGTVAATEEVLGTSDHAPIVLDFRL